MIIHQNKRATGISWIRFDLLKKRIYIYMFSLVTCQEGIVILIDYRFPSFRYVYNFDRFFYFSRPIYMHAYAENESTRFLSYRFCSVLFSVSSLYLFFFT